MTSKANHLPDLNTLSAEIIRQDTGLFDAFNKIASALDEDSAEAIIMHLSSKPGLLEYIFSGKYTC